MCNHGADVRGIPNGVMKIFIDSCAWNTLFLHKISLAKELPKDQFALLMTKEISAFEVAAIPSEQVELLDYINQQKAENDIHIDSYFAFASYDDPPNKRYRTGGFDEGRFIDPAEIELLEVFKVPEEKETGAGLYKNEGDASLAVRACFGCVVLTAEDPQKRGPLKKAAARNGLVVYLKDFDPAQTALRSFIESQVKAIQARSAR